MTKLDDLQKMTAVKLREMCDEFEEIQGASGMNKEQLIEVIVEALKKRGKFEAEEVKSEELNRMEKDRMEFRKEMKQLIKEKRTLLAAEEHDHEKLKEVRSKIKRLRRRIRRIHVREQQLMKILKIQK